MTTSGADNTDSDVSAAAPGPRRCPVGFLGIVGSLSAVVFDLVTVVVFGFYLAGDGPNFFRSVAATMSPRAQTVFLNVSEITMAKTGGYVVSKIVLATVFTTPWKGLAVIAFSADQHRYELVPEDSGSGDTLATDTT